MDVNHQPTSLWSHKYRGATVADLDPPSALSLNPTTPISHALAAAYERDYTHLTIISSTTRKLLGYLSIPHLKDLLADGRVSETDEVRKAMVRFERARKGEGKAYRVITMDTPLEELEEFFFGAVQEGKVKAASGQVAGGIAADRQVVQEFAVVTDEARRFVLGVATVQDLEEFVKRRPD